MFRLLPGRQRPPWRGSRPVVSTWLIAGLLVQPAARQRRLPLARAPVVSCTTAGQCMSLGLFYLNNDDITDRAADYLRTVVTRYSMVSPADAERAQYFLGSYYQRKFYIQRQRNRGREDTGLLRRAQAEYRGYTDRYAAAGTGQWLGDAYFGAALAAIELQDAPGAKDLATRMFQAGSRDPQVYVYEVVWSPSRSDVVDNYVDTPTLAKQVLSMLGTPSERLFGYLTKWCQAQRGRRMAK